MPGDHPQDDPIPEDLCQPIPEKTETATKAVFGSMVRELERREKLLGRTGFIELTSVSEGRFWVNKAALTVIEPSPTGTSVLVSAGALTRNILVNEYPETILAMLVDPRHR